MNNFRPNFIISMITWLKFSVLEAHFKKQNYSVFLPHSQILAWCDSVIKERKIQCSMHVITKGGCVAWHLKVCWVHPWSKGPKNAPSHAHSSLLAPITLHPFSRTVYSPFSHRFTLKYSPSMRPSCFHLLFHLFHYEHQHISYSSTLHFISFPYSVALKFPSEPLLFSIPLSPSIPASFLYIKVGIIIVKVKIDL